MLKRIFEEPLFFFLLIGSAAYIIYQFLIPSSLEKIIVKPEVIRGIEENQKLLLGRDVTKEDIALAVQSYIEDEVLIREAVKRKYDKADGRVRQRLLSMMRFSLDEQVPEPSINQLKVYYEENKPKYITPEKIQFNEVYFPFGSSNIPIDSTEFLTQLEKGSSSTENVPIREITESQIKQYFIDSDNNRFIYSVEMEWIGPLKSKEGIHYIRKVGIIEQDEPEFEDILNYIKEDWVFLKKKEIQNKKIELMKKNYEIVYE